MGWRPIACILMIGIAGCGHVPDSPELSDHRGNYSYQFERERFLPCDSDEQWWVVDQSDLHLRYQDMSERHGMDIFVHLRGTVSEPGQHGHLGLYSRTFTVYEVIEIRESGECPSM